MEIKLVSNNRKKMGYKIYSNFNCPAEGVTENIVDRFHY